MDGGTGDSEEIADPLSGWDVFRVRDRGIICSPLGEIWKRFDADRPDGEGGARQEVDACGLGAGEALVEGDGEPDGEALREGDGELLGVRRGEGRGKS